MNYARFLTLPFLVVIIINLYHIFVHDRIFQSIWIAVGVVCIFIIMIFEPQINWLFWKKWPPKIDEKLLKILKAFWPELDQKDDNLKQKLINRLVLFTRAHDMKFANETDLPIDIKTMVASIPVRMTTNKENDQYLMQPFERIYFYKSKFPSPDRPYPHTSETHYEDGVILFSLQHFIAAFKDPQKNFPIGFYEYAGIYKHIMTAVDLPDYSEEDLGVLEAIGPGYKLEQIKKMYGYPEIDLQQFAIVCFFSYPESFKRIDEERYNQFKTFFLS